MVENVANQKAIDADAADTLSQSWCGTHKRPRRLYSDRVWSCPECEADACMDYLRERQEQTEPLGEWEPGEEAV